MVKGLVYIYQCFTVTLKPFTSGVTVFKLDFSLDVLYNGHIFQGQLPPSKVWSHQSAAWVKCWCVGHWTSINNFSVRTFSFLLCEGTKICIFPPASPRLFGVEPVRVRNSIYMTYRTRPRHPEVTPKQETPRPKLQASYPTVYPVSQRGHKVMITQQQ